MAGPELEGCKPNYAKISQRLESSRIHESNITAYVTEEKTTFMFYA